MVTRRQLLCSLVTGTAAAYDPRLTELAHPKTHFRLPQWNDLSEWQFRSRKLRQQILGAAGLLPFPERPPVHSERIKVNRNDDWVSEAVLFESLPGYFVGGTIYRPVDSTTRWPGVLIPHGHWKHGRVEHLESYSVPALGVLLARQGYVAFAWDMVGYNDTTQTPHDFSGRREELWGFTPLGLQLWNSIRALDYLRSRPDVNPNSIGCTGASGGATQTILLTAVDPRVRCSAPVNMISASYQGADPCEEAPNLRLGTNNVEIAAMMAPRPMMIVSCSGDWTRNTPREEFPAIRQVYRLYGRPNNVVNAHFEAEHNYNRETRAAVCRFLDRWLPSPAGARDLTERDLGDIRISDLLVFEKSPERDYDAVFNAWRQPRAANRQQQKAALAAALGSEWPATTWSHQLADGDVIGRHRSGDWLPVYRRDGEGVPIVAVHPLGGLAALDALGPTARPVVAVDVFGTGASDARRETGGRWFLSYNQTDSANRVQDILTALSWTKARTQTWPVLAGFGEAGIWCAFAAAIAPPQVQVMADMGNFAGTDEDFERVFFVPGIQRAGGLPAVLNLLGSRLSRLPRPLPPRQESE